MSAPLFLTAESNQLSFEGLLNEVLNNQEQLTAAESFSSWHDDHLQRPDLESHYLALMPTTLPADGQQYAFDVDLDSCSGCKACVVACHNLNNLESSETWRKVGWLTSHQTSLPVVQHVTTACHHCVEPGCLIGCPVKAYEKDPRTGIVRHLDDQCFGCKYCTMMCPYEVPQYSSTLGIVRKCDMCHQRLSVGEAPACVQACPNQAIKIKIVDVQEVRKACNAPWATLLPTAPVSKITLPTTQFHSKRQLVSDLVSAESVHDKPHEGHLPLVAMLVLTQLSVGFWMVLAVALSLLATSVKSSVHFPGLALVATMVGILGVHLALLHLGRPHLAFRAFLGWRTSWLSREAIAFGAFIGAASLATLTMWQPLVLPGLISDDISYRSRLLLTWSTAIVGVLAVVCSAMIYVATRRSLWNAPRSLPGFLGTSAALGLASFAALINFQPWIVIRLPVGWSPCDLSGLNRYENWLTIFPLGLSVVISFAVFSVQACDFLRSQLQKISWESRGESSHTRESSHLGYSIRSGRLLAGPLLGWWTALWVAWGVALVSSLTICAIGTSRTAISMIWIALFFSHFIHRWLYFSSVVTDRMPGAST